MSPRNGPDEEQLGLFAEEPVQRPVDPELSALGEAVPKHVRLGTSSWTFPGWKGLVYHARYPNQRAFTRDSLAEYARHPLFRTVGVDRSHYAPLTRDELGHYAAQLPDDFRCVLKVWDGITTMVFPDHERYGALRGQVNPHFLDVARFREEVGGPVLDTFRQHTGALVLEVAPMRRAPDPRVFEKRLEHFLHEAPTGVHYAVELRNPELFTERYLDILRHHGASHVLNFWTNMPTLREQLARPGSLPVPKVIVRLLLPPFRGYEERRAELLPFDRIVDPQPAMREDVLAIADEAGELGYEVYVIVNNKAEGSSPLTVKELARLFRGR